MTDKLFSVPTKNKKQRRWIRYLSGIGLIVGLALILYGPPLPPGSRADNHGSHDNRGAGNQAIVETVPEARDLIEARYTGKGVTVGHVEGSPGDYLPNFRDRRFFGMQLTARSGTSAINSHANGTARTLYGRDGLAPGIKDVYFYTTWHWMGPQVLRAGSDDPPIADGRRLFTHSWIGHAGGMAADVLRRIDYLIDEYDTVMVVGVNNGANSKVPALLASAHNVIAVGKANGDSSGKYTRFEGRGRCKPEVVARRSTTSGATPVVAAVVARLLEAADQLEDSEAQQSEVIKAIVMAGAHKPTGWQCAVGKPLDEHLGAGIVRLGASLDILMAGRPKSEQTIDRQGWDFQTLASNQHRNYELVLDTPNVNVSIILIWHRRIDGRKITDLVTGQAKWLDNALVANLDLRVSRKDQKGGHQVIAQSTSSIDNVEHIYLQQPPMGRYDVQVLRQDHIAQDWDYAIAWRVEKQPVVAKQ